MKRPSYGLTAFALLALALVLSSCASRQSVVSSAEKAAAVAWDATNASRIAFTDWELKQTPEERGTTYEETMRAIALHEARVKAVTKAFVIAYATIRVVVEMIPLVKAEKLPPERLYVALAASLAAGEALKRAFVAAVDD